MEQDDAVGLYIPQDRLYHLRRVPALPVPGVHRPFDHGHRDLFLRSRRNESVGRAQPIRAGAQQICQKGICLPHFLPNGIRRGVIQPHMAPGVVADLVALRLHSLHQLRICFRFFPYQKKSGAGAPLPQAIQQAAGRSLPGAVIKCQGDVTGARGDLRWCVRGYGSSASAAAQRRQNGEYSRRQLLFSHRQHLPAQKIQR